MKNSEAIELNAMLMQTNFNEIKDGSFQYAITKNRRLLQKTMKELQKDIDSMRGEGFAKLQDELRELIASAQQDEKNAGFSPAKIQRLVMDDWENTRLYKELEKDFEQLLQKTYDEESEFQPHKIAKSLIEKLPLNDFHMQAVFDLIDDEK